MTDGRRSAVARARASMEDGTYLDRLRAMIAIPSVSQLPDHAPELGRYLTECVGPMLVGMGFEVVCHPNPKPGAGPILLATRLEDPAKPTALIYGHGDVVSGQPDLWREGLDPWVVSVEGERIYGRGTADNKGQHLIAIQALEGVIAERGSLGFNAKVVVETGEEVGSPGLREFLATNRDLCSADLFIGLDGPRQSTKIPELRLGARGGIFIDLLVNLREAGHHSGHWGGLLPDAGFILAHALSTIVSPKGRILVEGWTPEGIPQSVRDACRDIRFELLPTMPEIDPDWGEPDLSRAEKLYAWTTVAVLAFVTGRPEAPVNAVQGKAKARIQVRHDVAVDGSAIIPALRRHLARHGLERVEVREVKERDKFPPSRTDPADPWVQRLAASMRETTGVAPNIIPNSSGGNPSAYFKEELGTPVIWVPSSYAASGQHAADEHLLIPVVREGLGVMAGIFWDLGE